MKIAIVDTQTTGHHFEYIYGLCSEINNFAKQIDVYCNSDIYEYINENNLPAIDKNNNPELKSGLLEQPSGNWLQILRIAYRNVKKLSEYDQIIFLTLNIYFTALLFYSLFTKPSFSFSGIYFNPHVRKKNDVKNWIRDFTLKKLLKRYDCRIFILNDRETVEGLNRKFSTDVFEVLPDPIPEFYYSYLDRVDASSSTSKLFTMIGSISRRKGVFEFLKAIEQSESKNKFLIAGKVQDRIVEDIEKKVGWLKEKEINIELKNQFLSNREFVQIVTDSDVIVMPYLTKGASSGILGHAAFSTTPVIGPKEGLLSNIIKKYELGVTINPFDIPSFAHYLKHSDYVSVEANIIGMKKYVSKNSIKSFLQKMIKI